MRAKSRPPVLPLVMRAMVSTKTTSAPSTWLNEQNGPTLPDPDVPTRDGRLALTDATMDHPSRVLLVSPVRNETAHIERVVGAVAGQTRPPDRWIVADDGSEDDTFAILQRLEAEIDFLTVLAVPPRPRA